MSGGVDWPAGVRLAALQEVDSTNLEAARRAAAGEPGPLWITATRQTAGRGRRGRAWRSGADDLKASLLLRPDAPPERVATLSFVAALAVRDAAAAFAPAAPLTLKWPNDVLLDGRKLAGLLLEAQMDWVVIGIGLNLVSAPTADKLEPDALTPAALAEVAPPPRPEVALTALAAGMARRLDQWREGGFEAIRRDWLAHAAGLGAEIIARLPQETLRGRFADVDGSGALVLETLSGVRRIAAADVFFPAPGRAADRPSAGP